MLTYIKVRLNLLVHGTFILRVWLILM